jgi:hypothetical protein
MEGAPRLTTFQAQPTPDCALQARYLPDTPAERS